MALVPGHVSFNMYGEVVVVLGVIGTRLSPSGMLRVRLATVEISV